MMKANVQLLRKQGQLNEAYNLASKLLQSNPGDVHIKNDLLWVYYDFTKKQIGQSNYHNIYKIMRQVCKLNIHDNQMFNNSFNWQLIKLIDQSEINSHHQQQLMDVFKSCHLMLQNQPESESKSVLIHKMVKKLKNQNNTWKLLNFLDFKHYRKQDFDNQIYMGKRMMPLYEQTLYAFLKNWLTAAKDHHQEALDDLPYIENQLMLIANNYRFKFLNYYFAQLYLLIDEYNKAGEKALVFLKNNVQQAWAWELLAKTATKESKIIYLSKALSLQKKEGYQVNILGEIISYYQEQGQQQFAAYYAQKLIKIREKAAWFVPEYLHDTHLSMVIDEHLQEQILSELKHNTDQALMAAFPDVQRELMVVSGHNTTKNLYYLLSGNGNKYSFKTKNRLAQGQIIQANILNRHIVDFQAMQVDELNTPYIRIFRSAFKAVKDFGFVGNAFVTPTMIRATTILNTRITVLAIKEDVKKSGKKAWRVLKMIK